MRYMSYYTNSRPRRQRMSTNRASSRKWSVEDVWAAAAAAQRVNGEYLREARVDIDAAGNSVVRQRRNRDIMMEFLANPETMLAQDREHGNQCRVGIAQDLTLRALRNSLTEFDRTVQQVLAVQDQFDENTNRYQLAIVACLPQSYQRNQQRAAVTEAMQFATGGLIGKVNDRVQARVQVLSMEFSRNWGIWFIKGMTEQGQAVMFSQSGNAKYEVNTWIEIKGRVKAHRDNLTQLNYVKVQK